MLCGTHKHTHELCSTSSSGRLKLNKQMLNDFFVVVDLEFFNMTLRPRQSHICMYIYVWWNEVQKKVYFAFVAPRLATKDWMLGEPFFALNFLQLICAHTYTRTIHTLYLRTRLCTAILQLISVNGQGT